jgi:probable phosphoglycerate mutase
MTRLLIARHGNTFDKGDVLLRVGKRTDLPLSTSGKEQAEKLGAYLAKKYTKIDKVFSSNLMRTKDTAKIALKTMGVFDADVTASDIFDEIDYGLDEGKTEEEVILRLGVEALKKWDEQAIAPKGWLVDVEQIKENWIDFADSINKSNEVILVVTSNGTVRFAPYILDNPDEFIASNNIKLATGAVSCFAFEGGKWKVEYWGYKP